MSSGMVAKLERLDAQERVGAKPKVARTSLFTSDRGSRLLWPTVVGNPSKSQSTAKGDFGRCFTRMSGFSHLAAVLPASKQELIWWSCFSLLTLLVFKILLRSDAEDAIEFSVPVPEACRSGWEGKELHEPSIKVPLV
jgi:hypothetical protein